MQKRYKHIDIAKGLGILLVVLGHNWLVSNDKGELFNIIFSFHIPLFFFLSGLFFKPSRSLLYMTKNKADALLKPYFITLLTIGFAFALYKGVDLKNYFVKVFYGNGNSFPWVALWFLPHLFAVTILSWVIYYTFKTKGTPETIRYLIIFSFLCIGVTFLNNIGPINILFCDHKYETQGFPFSIDIIPITVFYFMLGFFLKHHVYRFKPSAPLVLTAITIFSSCHFFFNKTIDLYLRIYDGILIPTAEALCGIYLILAVAYMLQFTRITSFLLVKIGSASLFILLFHSFFQNRAFSLACNFLERDNIFVTLFSFTVGSLVPVCIWTVFKRFNLIALLFLPTKSKRI